MKIIYISGAIPFHENLRGTTALPYHLMVHRNRDITIEIYSYNSNRLTEKQIQQVEQELNVKIHVVKRYGFLIGIIEQFLFLRILLKYPYLYYQKLAKNIVDEINKKRPDGIWVYGEEMDRVVRQFPRYKRIHTFPDCEWLYYYRLLRLHFVVSNWKQYMRALFMMPKYMRMERDCCQDATVLHHLVGDMDLQMFKSLHPKSNAIFLRHPHYDIYPLKKDVSFSCPKIKLLITGQNNIYMHEGVKEMIDAFVENNEYSKSLTSSYEITFLGKGWENETKQLRAIGFPTNHLQYAEIYVEEIRKYDVQLSPIVIGTGTKGKVLDALANGLLLIGTPFALENVAVENMVSCVEYHSGSELIKILLDIKGNKTMYEDIARKGRDMIMTLHSRKLLSSELFKFYA